MATLITVGNSEGERRCDAKCYNSKSADCTCVCHGMNHGIGYKKAVENVERHAKDLLEKIKMENPKMTVIINEIQESIFKQ